MLKRFLPVAFGSFFIATLISGGCTKLDTTTLGSDLIPVVDNIHTFDTTLSIITTQGYFNDSFKIFKSENNVLGYINNDLLFGQTEANLFLQPKPTFFPYFFGNAADSLIKVDSVVLCLSFNGSWGDTTKLQTLRVFEIKDSDFGDSAFKFRTINYQPNLGTEVGSRIIDIRTLAQKVVIANGKDSVTNQIRIKLSDNYRNTLFGRDSLKISPTDNNAFRNDSLFRKKFYNGLAVKSGGDANALMYIKLADPKTRVEVHFSKKNITTGKVDTVYSSLTISTNDFSTILPSATSNYIKRTWSNNVLNPLASELYLQTGPGTFANLSIPGLSNLNNRIIHRAQISIEQIPENPLTDSIFSVPPYLYLDLKDTGATKWKPLYFDLNPNTAYDPDFKSGFPYFPGSGEIDYAYFGGFARKKINAVGQSVYYYDLNVTRYVQQLVTKRTPNYEMRLFPGVRIFYPQFGTAAVPVSAVSLNNPLAFGRIKIKSGSHPDPKVKMRMRIIYSKL